jgi:hypothetical protein
MRCYRVNHRLRIRVERIGAGICVSTGIAPLVSTTATGGASVLLFSNTTGALVLVAFSTVVLP